jgi:SAM-dependent methyltransferase
MHDTSLACGQAVAKIFARPGVRVVDIGGLSVSGTLRQAFEEGGAQFTSVDMDSHPSVDVVVKAGEPLPFATGSIDLVVSSSCFEHDPMFWLTFREMSRIVKLGGYIYVSAPSNGVYHAYPGDSWRFYSDAGQSLAVWSGKQLGNEDVFPTRVSEVFHILPKDDIWIDFVCLWERVESKETNIQTPSEIVNKKGPLKVLLQNNGFRTSDRFPINVHQSYTIARNIL